VVRYLLKKKQPSGNRYIITYYETFKVTLYLSYIYRLLLSFMLTTMLLSMWMSNTAATTIMIPVLDAVVQELYGV